MPKLAFSLLTTMELIGCVTGKTTYKGPRVGESVKNSVLVDRPKDEVWKQLIAKMGQKFYVINNIDKDYGLINISYSGDPEPYVDCGLISSWVKNLRGRREYIFPASRGSQIYEVAYGGDLIAINRTMKLEGRANILVQEIEDSKTMVTCNVRYVLVKHVESNVAGAEVIYGRGAGRSSSSESLSFNTNERASFSNSTTVCRSTGKLEREVLGLVESESAPNE